MAHLTMSGISLHDIHLLLSLFSSHHQHPWIFLANPPHCTFDFQILLSTRMLTSTAKLGFRSVKETLGTLRKRCCWILVAEVKFFEWKEAVKALFGCARVIKCYLNNEAAERTLWTLWKGVVESHRISFKDIVKSHGSRASWLIHQYPLLKDLTFINK